MIYKDFYSELLNESVSLNVVYHVTTEMGLKTIKRRGIEPNIPHDFTEDQKVVYLFKTRDDVKEAMMNWMVDRYDDDVKLYLLTIDSSTLELYETEAEYEVVSYKTINPNLIIKIEDLDEIYN